MPRPIAPGLIQGALRGLLAGAFTAAVCAALLAACGDGVHQEEVVLIFAAPILATALGASDGIEARIGPNILVRLAAPIHGGALTAMVVASIQEILAGRTALFVPGPSVALACAGGAVIGVPIGAACVVAGPHVPGAPVSRRYTRALIGAAVLEMPFCFARGIGVGLALLVVTAIYCTGHIVVRPIGRSIGEWLEPKDEEEPQPAPPPPIA